MTLSHQLYGDLIGAPFAKDGRGPAAYDCLGLGIEIMRRRGFTLPAYISDQAELHRQLASGGEMLAGMQRVLQPEGGEVALFSGAPCHIGIMINPWHMIHIEAGTSCVVERVASPLWRRRLRGYYVIAERAE